MVTISFDPTFRWSAIKSHFELGFYAINVHMYLNVFLCVSVRASALSAVKAWSDLSSWKSPFGVAFFSPGKLYWIWVKKNN